MRYSFCDKHTRSTIFFLMILLSFDFYPFILSSYQYWPSEKQFWFIVQLLATVWLESCPTAAFIKSSFFFFFFLSVFFLSYLYILSPYFLSFNLLSFYLFNLLSSPWDWWIAQLSTTVQLESRPTAAFILFFSLLPFWSIYFLSFYNVVFLSF